MKSGESLGPYQARRSRDSRGARCRGLQRARDGGFRDYVFIEQSDPEAAARFIDFIERMRRDVAARRERARARGLLDVSGGLGPPQ